MKIRKAYKFRIKETDELLAQLENIAGACRFLWNKVLALNLYRLEHHQPIIRYHEADFWCKLWKASDDYDFLRQVPAHCLQQKLMDLDKAFKDGFDKAQILKRLPRFKKRGLSDSIRYPAPGQFKIENKRIKLPKLGWVGFFKSQDIVGKVRNATLKREGNRWFVSIQVEQIIEEPASKPTAAIGIDVGIAHFATCSDGTQFESPRAFRTHEKQLARAQRQLSKKKKYSANWKKQLKKVNAVHSKIANIRRDFLHKLSTRLSKSHALIVLEALKISNMVRSAKGTVDKPGKNVSAKSGLNKSLSDQGFGEFRRQLIYKLAWLGGVLVQVPPQYTSQRCYACGHTEKGNRPTQARFACLRCGHDDHADINAAKNILAAGHAVLACGESGLPLSVKQESREIGDLVPA